MQKCQICKKDLQDGPVMVKCVADFENFSEKVHKVQPQEVEAIWCMECEEKEND